MSAITTIIPYSQSSHRNKWFRVEPWKKSSCVVVSLGFLVWIASCGGCVLPWITVPLNSPGYGHTYEVADPKGKPVLDGLLLLYSQFQLNGTMIGCCEIKNGKARVPIRIGTRTGFYGTLFMYGIAGIVKVENPNYTYVYPFVPGYGPAWKCDFIGDELHRENGISSPPKVITVAPISADREREDLRELATWLPNIILQLKRKDECYGAHEEDIPAATKLLGYVKRRLNELPPNAH